MWGDVTDGPEKYAWEKVYGSKENTHANFHVISTFQLGQYYPNITERVVLENSFYDSETHKYLGKYLECLRSLYRIDLFSMYNCYNAEQFDNIQIDDRISGNFAEDSINLPNLIKLFVIQSLFLFPWQQ